MEGKSIFDNDEREIALSNERRAHKGFQFWKLFQATADLQYGDPKYRTVHGSTQLYRSLLVRKNFQPTLLGNEEQDENSCVFALKYNQPGTILAFSTGINTLKLVDSCTQKTILSSTYHSQIVSSVSFLNTEANRLGFVSCSVDKSMVLWRNLEPITRFPEQDDWIRAAAVCPQDTTLISGSVSSIIYGWDVATCSRLFSINNAQTESRNILNTINGLEFADSCSVFLSGSRDGFMRLWDSRIPTAPISELYAHTDKLNTCILNSSSLFILSCGRDNTIRLWDRRKMTDILCAPNSNPSLSAALLREYTGHCCSQVNCNSTFFNDEQHIVTGGEDNCIVVYDKLSGAIVNRIDCANRIIHAVDTSMASSAPVIASASTSSPAVCLWCVNSLQADVRYPPEPQISEVRRTQQRVIERFMLKYGERVLRFFHEHRISFNLYCPLEELRQAAIAANSPRALEEVTSIFEEMSLEYHQTMTEDTNECKKNSLSPRKVTNRTELSRNELTTMELLRYLISKHKLHKQLLSVSSTQASSIQPASISSAQFVSISSTEPVSISSAQPVSISSAQPVSISSAQPVSISSGITDISSAVTHTADTEL